MWEDRPYSPKVSDQQTRSPHHHHHQSTFSIRSVFVGQPFVCCLWRVAMMMAERVGAAKRRRQRRLRSWAKHERMTVAMALAENLHHSRQKVEGDEHEGPRAQKTARVSGALPGVLTEPESQGGAATVGYVAAPGPLLEVALMAGGDSVDGTSLQFLVKKALDRQKEEEKKRKEEEMLDILRRFRADLPVSDSEWEA